MILTVLALSQAIIILTSILPGKNYTYLPALSQARIILTSKLPG
jgi:hypothetical protein